MALFNIITEEIICENIQFTADNNTITMDNNTITMDTLFLNTCEDNG